MNLVNKLFGVPEEFESTDNSKFYKPMGLNFYSSFLFLIPCLYAYINNQKKILIGFFIIFTVSVLNHGTYNYKLNILDKIVANITIFYFLINYFRFNIYYILSLVVFIVIIFEFLYFKCSYHPTNSIKHHSIIHIMITIGKLLLIESKK